MLMLTHSQSGEAQQDHVRQPIVRWHTLPISSLPGVAFSEVMHCVNLRLVTVHTFFFFFFPVDQFFFFFFFFFNKNKKKKKNCIHTH